MTVSSAVDPNICMTLVPGDIVEAVPSADGLITITHIINGVPGVVMMLDCSGESPYPPEELFNKINKSWVGLLRVATFSSAGRGSGQ